MRIVGFSRNALVVLAAMACLLTADQGSATELPDSGDKLDTLVLEDLDDISDWYNGSPEETTLTVTDQGPSDNQVSTQPVRALRFANRVDHTKGEKNYPIGWPRVGKDLRSSGLTDWSDWDFFECMIYAKTSREALPKSPLSVGFYHSGHKRSSHFRLDKVTKGAWAKIRIPTEKLLDSADVQRLQFNISESDYRHGDRVEFLIRDLSLRRYKTPAVADVTPSRRLLYVSDDGLSAQYRLVGFRGQPAIQIEAVVSRGDQVFGKGTVAADRRGEIHLPITPPLPPGECRLQLSVFDQQRVMLDRREVLLRVIPGPFDEEDIP